MAYVNTGGLVTVMIQRRKQRREEEAREREREQAQKREEVQTQYQPQYRLQYQQVYYKRREQTCSDCHSTEWWYPTGNKGCSAGATGYPVAGTVSLALVAYLIIRRARQRYDLRRHLPL